MKKIVIDGHNLIPKVPGIHLADPDDENKLIQMIGEYCRLSRTRADLFFDGAPAGSTPRSRHGLVSVHHVKQGGTADDAIIRHLRREGQNARNILVISSDHRVQVEAKALRAETMTSEAFNTSMQQTFSSPAVIDAIRNKPPSEAEVEEMLKLMQETRKKS